MATPSPVKDLGIDFIKAQDAVFFRQAWVNRWVSWLCGWGGAVLAAFGAVSIKLYPDNHTLPVWCGLLAAALTGIVQTVKPDVWADAYYRGHLLLEQAIGDHLLGNAASEDLVKAWHAAQGGMPGASPFPGKN